MCGACGFSCFQHSHSKWTCRPGPARPSQTWFYPGSLTRAWSSLRRSGLFVCLFVCLFVFIFYKNFADQQIDYWRQCCFPIRAQYLSRGSKGAWREQGAQFEISSIVEGNANFRACESFLELANTFQACRKINEGIISGSTFVFIIFRLWASFNPLCALLIPSQPILSHLPTSLQRIV